MCEEKIIFNEDHELIFWLYRGKYQGLSSACPCVTPAKQVEVRIGGKERERESVRKWCDTCRILFGFETPEKKKCQRKMCDLFLIFLLSFLRRKDITKQMDSNYHTSKLKHAKK